MVSLEGATLAIEIDFGADSIPSESALTTTIIELEQSGEDVTN
jgi:hypothetical protein